MSAEKLKAVLILGPGHIQYDKDIKELAKLYSKPGYLMIGDGSKFLTKESLNVLQGKLDQYTRIDLDFHGGISNDGNHYIQLGESGYETALLFIWLREYSSNTPLQVHLWSCYGGNANKDVKYLSECSVLFNHIPSQYTILSPLALYAIKSSFLKLKENADKQSSSIEDVIDNLPINLLQTASISTYVNGNNYQLILEPKLSEVTSNLDIVLKEEIDKIAEFAHNMHKLITAKDQSIYTNFKIKAPIAKSFSEQEKREFQLGYFIHASHIGNTKEIAQTIESSSAIYIEKLINQDVYDISPLFVAADSGNIGIVELMIDNNADIDKANRSGDTPLFKCVQNGDIKTVKALLDNNANVNIASQGVTPLYIAAQNGFADIVTLLVEHKAEIDKTSESSGSTPLCIAAQMGHAEVVKILAEYNADVDKPENKGITPLWLAVYNRHAEVVKILAEHNADVDKGWQSGSTPLWLAASKGHIEIVNILINNKANVDKEPSIYDGTPLLQAAVKGHFKIVALLASAKADVDKVGFDGSTPLLSATGIGNTEVVKTLIENKADVNKNNGGVTPLHLAANYGHLEIVKLLLKAKANLTAKIFNSGETPLDLAKQQRHIEIVKLLEDAIEAEQKASVIADNQMHELIGEYGDHEATHLYQDEL